MMNSSDVFTNLFYDFVSTNEKHQKTTANIKEVGTVKSQFKKLQFKKKSRFKKDCPFINRAHNMLFSDEKETNYHNCFWFFLQRSGSALAAAPGTLEEKLKELEKSKDYSTGLNNLVADNVDLPKNSTVKLG